jgi:pSer/pThr/pTyr-binding forkhead associated (FHA) protein
MIVECGGCAKRYRFDEAKLQGRTSATLTCPNCKASISITAAAHPGDQTTRLAADADLIPSSSKVRGGDLVMPKARRISLAVLEGKDIGRIFTVDKPHVTIGRSDADIILEDHEVSRQHAAIEMHGPRAVLKDLGSTNGTFINEVKITQTEIENRGEFRVGGTRLMLILVDLESELEPLS